MTVLSSDILQHHGPYLRLADCPKRLENSEGDWPERTLYQDFVFFEFADDLLETYCSLTHSYSPFDPYGLIPWDEPHRILTFSSELLLWALQLARCRPGDFEQHLNIYEHSTRFNAGEAARPEHLQQDMLETLIFLAATFHRIAFFNDVF
ncbi:MAG: hypothetical protein M1398_06265 [Deltaproteobacteria bacterium]|jgi:hypothetical protein|nr:hypothetical protein [Deltaproteobacteria bacterium]MDA8307174.1 hypothetical protein [Deltaproteobacteria bacterium]